MIKASGDVIILHMYSKNNNHMMHASWDMKYDRHNFLSLWAIFCPFTPLLTPKIKIWNKCKNKPGDIILLDMCTINEDHMMYSSWDLRHNKLSFFLILGHFLPFDPPNNLKNHSFEKNKKDTWRYYHFTSAYHKWSSYDV